MGQIVKNETMTRMNFRLTEADKELFEYASDLAGIPSLSEFIRSIVKEKAEEIIDKHNTILASEKDREIFFDALMNAPEPNEALKKAFNSYMNVMAT